MIGWLTSLFCRGQSQSWDLRQIQRLVEQEVAAAIERGDVGSFEVESVTKDLLADTIPELGASMLAELKRTAPSMIREHGRLDSGFRRRNYRRWKDGLDLLRIMLRASQEVGSAYNNTKRPVAVESQDARFAALVNLHARALRVSEEIYSLLLAGYPDGALSRWRTLHEIAVIMTFLERNEPSISERFILHRDVAAFRAMSQYRRYQDRANLSPISDEDFKMLEERKNSVLKEHGPAMKSDYGWAAPMFGGKKPTLLDIEERLGLDHWRPRFKWASDDIHGAYKPFGSSLGTSEAKQEVLLVGASNSGFTDPAHMMAISLNLANHALLLSNPSLDLHIILYALRILSDEIGEVFLRVDRETQPNET